MGMGHAAAYADVIEAEEVEKRCRKPYREFLQALEEENITIEEFAMDFQYADENLPAGVVKAFGILAGNFEQKTGLKLGIAHHQSDEYGDRYDDVDGTYFWVDGMYELTKAGKKMNDVVSRKMFVQFG